MVDDHRHCLLCQKTIPSRESFCSERCKDDLEAMMKRDRKIRLLWITSFMIFMLVLLIKLFFV
jgi:predicted nucleic acid-binding Zn ribbon protein